MFPYLQKFQTFHPPNSKEVFNDLALDYIDQDAQGKSGPIQASYPQTVHPFGKAWIETFRALGHEITSDTMSGTNLGGYQIVSHIDPQKGERSHAGNAYLEGSFQRKNLDFVLDAEVEKVLFKKLPTLSATGVQYRRHGQTFIVEALKEVVICTGSFHSPCLLERSGIGDPKLLGSLGVDVIIPNPNVGENLQDHMLCGVAFEAKDEYETLDNFRDPEYAKAAMEEYQRSRAGPMTQTSSSFAYMSLTEDHISGETISMKDLLDQYPSHSKSPADTLIRQILSDPNEASVNFCMFQAQSHCDKSTLSEHFSITSPGKWASIFASLSHPLSRGSVHSQSINPSTPPVIDPRVYTHPLDVEIMSLHIRFFQKITSTAPFSSLLKPNGRRIPEFASFETLDDAKKVATKCTLSNMHPIGTCAMLPEEKGGVVDARLKVHGVKGLRICDASVMPILTRGNIISTVYAVAEKGADLIKEDLFGSY
ncbi:putative aryl-alcohol dehydrogenase [Phaeomoniella chlamydospora]|uniref:Putative aryl-alcohol dehydrogenase n=1 Tax=Phaeomoniella chlamydospora TaxID=158046 RepID=A0A0G2FYP2_PHACM|nr:putative aryl-alcohol dehydrogenase [Phaeomoniella chlamydospora]